MFFFLCKQKTAYEMRISDWSSDVCSSDLELRHRGRRGRAAEAITALVDRDVARDRPARSIRNEAQRPGDGRADIVAIDQHGAVGGDLHVDAEAVGGSDIKRGRSRDAALARRPGELVQHQPPAGERAVRAEIGDDGAGGTALDRKST